jgi:hypothetical protein
MPVVLRGHAQPVDQAAFSPDGRRVVTVAGRLAARVWLVDVKALLRQAHAATTACLSISAREAYLDESAEVAADAFAACERSYGRAQVP